MHYYHESSLFTVGNFDFHMSINGNMYVYASLALVPEMVVRRRDSGTRVATARVQHRALP